ncbi:hypothetical protein EHS13_22580 [Paenibacillus psychroresistens]|uniref:Uncharacterized protein n=1 Tax=Paenibacillus psychroresistens TaxID=1778678 RepID=A0A6B8RM46_9BACL|nr:hypothetical protein [Paenibacillus psychroresistens]QGQ97471.1 hypothetical protein EHS13_22580 [Paenibacillus psychroresistens]
MPNVLIILFFILVMVIIISAITKATGNSKAPRNQRIKKIAFSEDNLPTGLNFRQEMPLQDLELRLDKGLSALFLTQLKQRVLGAHPNVSSAEYEWKLLELKRYLAMNAILRQTPMFSEAVDEIWHEMIMFTREYQQLCERLTGGMIHHTPHVQKMSMPDERAWFDWVYGHLFEFTPYSNLIWNPFYKFPLSKQRMQQLRESNEQEIMEALFNVGAAERFPEVRAAIVSLIQQLKAQIDTADDPNQSYNRGSGMQSSDMMGYAASAMIFYSLMDNGSYADSMQEILPEEIQSENEGADSGGSSCGTGDNGSSDGGGSGGSDGGSDSGSSSSSSSCSSSSCGGGGGGD